MPRTAFSVLAFFAAALVTQAVEPKPLPRGFPADPLPLPPQFATIISMDEQRNWVVLEELDADREKIQDAGKAPSTSPPRHRIFDMKLGKIYDPQGSIVGADKAWQNLRVGAVILLSANGKKVRFLYRQSLSEDALIFVDPVPASGTGPAEVPDLKPTPATKKGH